MSTLSNKTRVLTSWLAGRESVLVCFSGGVDSALVLATAVDVLGERAVAFTATSASLTQSEQQAAVAFAAALGARHILLETRELDDPRYSDNPMNRCYFCKQELYSVALDLAEQQACSAVVDGFNRDDRKDTRPGRQAAVEHGVRSPLDEAGFSKSDVRAAAKLRGLEVWDKPALACLSSRIPHGSPITPGRLARVARAESALQALGFRVVRVRDHGGRASVELGKDELLRLEAPDLRAAVEEVVADAGFTSVEVDPSGYRMGSLNALPPQ